MSEKIFFFDVFEKNMEKCLEVWEKPCTFALAIQK